MEGAWNMNLMNMIEGRHGKAKLHAFTKQSLVKSFDCEAPCAALRPWLGYGELDPRSLGIQARRRMEMRGFGVAICFNLLTLRFLVQKTYRHSIFSTPGANRIFSFRFRWGMVAATAEVSLRSVGHWRLRRLCCFYTKDGRSSPKGLEKGRLKQFNGALVWRLAEVPEVIISLMYFVCILYCSCALSIAKIVLWACLFTVFT